MLEQVLNNLGGVSSPFPPLFIDGRSCIDFPEVSARGWRPSAARGKACLQKELLGECMLRPMGDMACGHPHALFSTNPVCDAGLQLLVHGHRGVPSHGAAVLPPVRQGLCQATRHRHQPRPGGEEGGQEESLLCAGTPAACLGDSCKGGSTGQLVSVPSHQMPSSPAACARPRPRCCQNALATVSNWNVSIMRNEDPLFERISLNTNNLANSFWWSHHTWSHQNLDNATFYDADMQVWRMLRAPMGCDGHSLSSAPGGGSHRVPSAPGQAPKLDLFMIFHPCPAARAEQGAGRNGEACCNRVVPLRGAGQTLLAHWGAVDPPHPR